MTRVSRHLRWYALGALACSAVLLVGCPSGKSGGPNTVAPPPKPQGGPAPVSQVPLVSSAPVNMAVVTLPDKEASFNTYANRGITNWKAVPSADRRSVTCSFRSTSDAVLSTHYGGVAIPVPGSKDFRLTMKFANAAAIRQLWLGALSPKSAEAGSWGARFPTPASKLRDGQVYTWRFAPGKVPSTAFWVTPKAISERGLLHVWLDVPPDQDFSFTILKVEREP